MKIGIIGAGKIAAKLAETIRGMDDTITLYGIASRSLLKAQTFSELWGCQVAYGSYEKLAEDPQVDLIYIATPHSHHFEHAKICIEHGKAVLVEKAFTANAHQAEELIRLAERMHVFLAEAAWTRYLPSRKMINDLMDGGVIGRVYSLTASIGYPIANLERLHTPSLAGGALLDIGYYPLTFALMAFGNEFKEVRCVGVKTTTGVDSQEGISLIYEDGRIAELFVTMNALTNRRGQINGDKGYLEVDNINNVQEICVYNENRELIAGYEVPKQITGYEYELIACKRAMDQGLLECPEMPHSETLRVMKLMDEIRRQIGVTYPFHGEDVL